VNDMLHFDGDPATDSARRRLERVLKSPEPPPRWPWILAALGGGGVWLLWRVGRGRARAAEMPANETNRDPMKVPDSRT
jgi:hypothetical protein